MKSFEQRIKALRAEVEALKAVKRKSSTALNTITKTVTCTSTVYRANGSGYYAAGTYVLRRIGQIEIVSTDGAPLLFSYYVAPYASRGNRPIRIMSWLSSNDNPAILADPIAGSGTDSTIPNGSTRDITMTIYITATADFTTNVSQLNYDLRT